MPHRQASRMPRPPVVVTFNREGDVLDVVGDLDWFIGDEDRNHLLAHLQDLRSGAGPAVRIPAVELATGRYADVQVLEEDENCHFVLRDASDAMLLLQKKQQASHDLELREHRQRKTLAQDPSRPRAQGLQLFRRDAELFARLIEDMRAPLALLNGHVHLLEKRLHADPAGLRSLAAIAHAGMLLDATANNALLSFGQPQTGEHDVLSLSHLAALLRQGFSLQASAQGVALELCLPPDEVFVEVDDLALRQLLTNLLIRALEGLQGGVLVVAFAVKTAALEIDICREPEGFDATRFGPLLTSTNLLQQGEPGGSYALAVSQQLLQRLQARLELAECQNGGHDLWMRIPVRRRVAQD